MEVTPGYKTINQCVCPGDSLIYTCRLHGDANGATVWNGTAFNGCLHNEITLLHSFFTPQQGVLGTCNNGAIVARSLGLEGSNYTSQLNVTITSNLAGKTITCAYDAMTANQANDRIHFSTKIPGKTVLYCTSACDCT